MGCVAREREKATAIFCVRRVHEKASNTNKVEKKKTTSDPMGSRLDASEHNNSNNKNTPCEPFFCCFACVCVYAPRVYLLELSVYDRDMC